MAIQDKYKKQPQIDFSSAEWEDLPIQNFNSPDFEDYNPELEIEYKKERPQIQKDFSAFETGMINMGGIRAPITGAMTGVAGLIGKAFGKNKKSFWENYQDGRDFVIQQNNQAKDDNSTAYHTGNIASALLLARGANKASGGAIQKALKTGGGKAKEFAGKLAQNKKIAEALKMVGKEITPKKAAKTALKLLAWEKLQDILGGK